MLTFEEFLITISNIVCDIVKNNDVQTHYEYYKIAFSMAKQFTNADDEALQDEILEYSVISPLTVNLYNNSFNGTTSESTSNDGISRSKSFSNADLLTPYKRQLAMYKRAKFI